MGELEKNFCKRFNFENWPQIANFEDYEENIRDYVTYLSQFSSIKAVYQLGTNQTPGISDIDICIVLKDKIKLTELKHLNFAPPKTKNNYFLFMHLPFIFNESVFKKINLLYPHVTPNLRRLTGDKINFKIESFKKHKLNQILNFVDLCNLLFPKDFLDPLLQKKIDVRYMLCRLSSLKYTLKFYQAITRDKKSHWLAFIDKMDGLKKEWFLKTNGQNPANLKEIIYDAFKFNYEIILDFSEHLQKKFGIKPSPNWTYNNPYHFIFFSKNLGLTEVEHQASNLHKKIGIVIYPIPSTLGIQLQSYISQNSYLGRYLSKFTSNKIRFPLDSPLSESITQRKLLLEEHFNFLEQNKLNFGYLLNFYGFQFKFSHYDKMYQYYTYLKSKYFYFQLQKCQFQMF